MKKVWEILDGVINDLYPDIEIEDEARRRLKICLTPDKYEPHCKYYSHNNLLGPKCTKCGCVLKYKVKSTTSKCPIKKWEKNENK